MNTFVDKYLYNISFYSLKHWKKEIRYNKEEDRKEGDELIEWIIEPINKKHSLIKISYDKNTKVYRTMVDEQSVFYGEIMELYRMYIMRRSDVKIDLSFYELGRKQCQRISIETEIPDFICMMAFGATKHFLRIIEGSFFTPI